MAIGIAATGVMGLALETTAGTFVAPTKWVPIRSESLSTTQALTYRRNIKGIADPTTPLAGNLTSEGDIEFEASPDVLPYFFRAMRTSEAKTGSGDPYQYVYTPTHGASSTSTLSLYVQRNGTNFAYLGVTVGKLSFTINDGILVGTASVGALSEATQSSTSPSYSNNNPFATGNYTVEVPNSSSITDVDNFTFDIEEGLSSNHRLNGSQNAASITLGERTVSSSLERDFEGRTNFDSFKAATATSLTVICTYSGGNRYLKLEMPVVTMESYEVNLASQGELVRASVNYTGSYSTSDTFAYRATVKTDENIT